MHRVSAYPARLERVYEPHEVFLGIAFAATMLFGFFALMVAAGQSEARIRAVEAPPPDGLPIRVRPVLDELPLLKQGGKKKVRPKLPEMWKKKPPVQRFEAASAPSPKAEKVPEKIPESKLVKPDTSAPPPDAEIAKEVDQVLLDKTPEAEPTVEGEGSPDGVQEGTETDPLKARALSAYHAKILAFLNRRFVPPNPEQAGVPCEEAKKLRASAQVSIGADRQISSFSVTSPSGNSAFDERVNSTLTGMTGEQLPPPPPLYPDIVQSSISVRYSGSNVQCE